MTTQVIPWIEMLRFPNGHIITNLDVGVILPCTMPHWRAPVVRK